MADYSIGDLVGAAQKAGFAGPSLVTAVAISLAEDGRMELKAVNVNSDPWHSRDRGPWQINDHWHPDVSDTCAFDLQCSAQAAYRISNSGSNFGPWATFANGSYKQHLSDATAALSGALTGGASSVVSDVTAPVTNAISAVTSQIVSAAQIAGGALIIGLGLAIAAVMLVLKNA